MSDGEITAETLRMAIRARISAGVSRRTITLLIQDYATDHSDGGVQRLPVELIPCQQRGAFLDALGALPDHSPIVVTKIQ